MSECFEEYFLSAAEMSKIIADFCEKFRIAEDEMRKRENHYQLSGSKNHRIQDNIGKIREMLDTYDVGFDSTDGVLNTLTKKVLPQQSPERFFHAEKTGDERYKCFVKERI